MTDEVDDNNRLRLIRERIFCSERLSGRPEGSVELIAVSKTFGEDSIRPLLEQGHRVFGENRVQEAISKWGAIDADNIELHLIGPLQSNKAREAVELFDVIHTIDRPKIARVVSEEMVRQGRHPKIFVQVNTGEESQKSGILPSSAVSFVRECVDDYNLKISGLMCIPPLGENPGPHFALLRDLALASGVSNLSMGMSSDFETAIELGATHVRVGSALFGERP